MFSESDVFVNSTFSDEATFFLGGSHENSRSTEQEQKPKELITVSGFVDPDSFSFEVRTGE
jgi:hypothetical protein